MTRRLTPGQREAAAAAEAAERNAGVLYLRNQAFNLTIAMGKAFADGQTGAGETIAVQVKTLLIAAENLERGVHRPGGAG